MSILEFRNWRFSHPTPPLSLPFHDFPNSVSLTISIRKDQKSIAERYLSTHEVTFFKRFFALGSTLFVAAMPRRLNTYKAIDPLKTRKRLGFHGLM